MSQNREKRETIETYNKSAAGYAKKFDEIGPRTKDIKRIFSYINKPNPKTIEIGCGNGRDAKEILKYTNDYLGIDLSSVMLQLARQNVPEAKFLLADLEEFQFPEGTDVIFAFASLLHSDRKSVKDVLERAYSTLNLGGIFFISSKYGNYHKEKLDKGFGPKTFYYYSPEEIEKLSPSELKTVYQEIYDFRGQRWFTIILQKE